MHRAVMRAQVRKMKAKARAVIVERWYELVYGPMAGAVVSDRGRALVNGVASEADVIVVGGKEVSVAEAVCFAWNGPPQPHSFKRAAFRNGNPEDRSFENVFWATPAIAPMEYDLQIRHVNGDLLDNRIENLFMNEDPRFPAKCWAVPHPGPSNK